jgi:hypothetical protein
VGDFAQNLRLHCQAEGKRGLVDELGWTATPVDPQHRPSVSFKKHLQVGHTRVAPGQGGEYATLIRQHRDTPTLLGKQPSRGSAVTSSATKVGITGTSIISAAIAASLASATACARPAGSALAAAAAARSAIPRAVDAASSASTIWGRIRSPSTRSARRSGSVIAVNTGDLRAPGGSATTVKMFTGSRHDPRTTTSTFPPAAVDNAASATQPARSGGV